MSATLYLFAPEVSTTPHDSGQRKPFSSSGAAAARPLMIIMRDRRRGNSGP